MITAATEAGPAALLRLLQLTSPALPVGAYAYSQGLEYAIEHDWLVDEYDLRRWLLGLIRRGLGALDLPLLLRLQRAWRRDDAAAVERHTYFLFASRETRELQQEDRQLGTALARLLDDLGVAGAADWRGRRRCCFATLFALAAARWDIPPRAAALGYGWAWTENQIAAAVKLVPLGQTAGQRLLGAMQPALDAAVARAWALTDDEIGFSAPALGVASARHETQYSRLFRS